MKSIHLHLLIAMASVIISCSRSPIPDDNQLEARIDSLINTVPDFSGVILVAEKGHPVYHKAFGFRNFAERIPLDTADIFELASLSKSFTSMVIMMLQEEGKLSYDDSLLTYIPALPYHGITIRHLLTHTSGLPDYQEVMDQHWDKSKVAGNADNIEYLIRYHPPLLFEPGSQYTYSNTGYMLVASIAEKVSGKDFIDLCRTRIFIPLGMGQTNIRTRAEKKAIPTFALGHIFVKEREKYVPADSFPEFNYAIWLGNRKGPGRISSTSSDLLKWDQALYKETLVQKTTLKNAFLPMRLTNDTISNYGFGWSISFSPKKGRIVSHTGDNPGYKTEIVRYLDKNKTIILLNNNAHEKKAEIMAALKEMI